MKGRVTAAWAIVFVSGAVAAVTGIISFASWFFSWQVLAEFRESNVVTSPDTALGLLLLSSVLLLWLFQPESRLTGSLGRAVAAGVSLFGLLMLANYVSGFVDFEIEHVFLFGHADALNRMSPVAAVNLFLSGLYLYMLTAGAGGRWLADLMSGIGAVVLLLAGVSVLGHLYGASDLYGGAVRPVALMTALAFVALGAGFIAAAGPGTWPYLIFSGSTLRARMLRIFLPLTLAMILFVSWFTSYLLQRSDVSASLLSALTFMVFSMLAVAIVVLAVGSVSRTVAIADARRKQAETALRENENRLQAIIENAPEGIVVADAQGSIFMANPAAEKLYGRQVPFGEPYQSREKMKIIHPSGRPYDPRLLPLTRSALDGLSFTDEEFDLEWPSGELRHMLANSSPIRNDDDLIVGAVGVFHDITERKQEQEQLAITARLNDSLNRINTLISTTFEFTEIMTRAIVEGTGAIGADSGAVIRREGDHWTVSFGYNLPMPLGTVLTDEDLPHAVEAAQNQEVVVVNDAQGDPRAGQRAVEAFQVKSFLAVPLVTRGETTGLIYFTHHTAPVRFRKAEIDFALKLSSLASLVLENARLYMAERNIAEALQEALMVTPGRFPGLDIAYTYRSATEEARVGGDFYDVFDLEDGRVGILIGDASGKGVTAAAMAALAHNSIKAYASLGDRPDKIVDRTNRLITRYHRDESAFATLFFGILEIGTGKLTYCIAGHPPPILKRRDGGVSLLVGGSPIIGAFLEFEYEQHEETLDPGDFLTLYTDGVTEARRENELFGQWRLLRLIIESKATAAGMPDDILARLMDFTQENLSDDVAVMVINRS